MNEEKRKIKKLVIESYLNGALNKMETRAMKKGYHKDFAIFYSEKKELRKLKLNDWIKIIENFKKEEKKGSGLRDFKYTFEEIDVTHKAAYVKLKLMRNNELIFTDYLTLLKFDNGWKIVTKIYNAHVENPWELNPNNNQQNL